MKLGCKSLGEEFSRLAKRIFDEDFREGSSLDFSDIV